VANGSLGAEPEEPISNVSFRFALIVLKKSALAPGSVR
jgi:hypothetical protein